MNKEGINHEKRRVTKDRKATVFQERPTDKKKITRTPTSLDKKEDVRWKRDEVM